jgi:hypothetical protein
LDEEGKNVEAYEGLCDEVRWYEEDAVVCCGEDGPD